MSRIITKLEAKYFWWDTNRLYVSGYLHSGEESHWFDEMMTDRFFTRFGQLDYADDCEIVLPDSKGEVEKWAPSLLLLHALFREILPDFSDKRWNHVVEAYKQAMTRRTDWATYNRPRISHIIRRMHGFDLDVEKLRSWCTFHVYESYRADMNAWSTLRDALDEDLELYEQHWKMIRGNRYCARLITRNLSLLPDPATELAEVL